MKKIYNLSLLIVLPIIVCFCKPEVTIHVEKVSDGSDFKLTDEERIILEEKRKEHIREYSLKNYNLDITLDQKMLRDLGVSENEVYKSIMQELISSYSKSGQTISKNQAEKLEIIINRDSYKLGDISEIDVKK